MLLVTGATGNVGSELVRALVAAGQSVRALVRDKSAGQIPGAEAVAGDLNDPASVVPALADVDAVFLLAGYRDASGLLAECRRAGVAHLVLLSSGAVVGGERTNAVTAYNMEAEDAVRAGGMSWTLLRPSGYMSNALQWVPQLRAGDVVREPFADVAVAAIDPHDIAAVAAVALSGGEHAGQAYRLTGPEAIRPADRVRALAEVLGRDLRFEAKSDEQARAEMSAAMPPEYVNAFFRYFADGTYDDSVVHPTVRQLTGLPPRTFTQWARTHAGAFR